MPVASSQPNTLEQPVVLGMDLEASRRVVVYDFGGDPSLVKALQHMHFETERAETRAIDPGRAKQLVAAIVSDAVDQPLDLCRDLSPSCPVIVLSDERSFSFRHAAAEAGVGALIRRPVSSLELSEWLEHFANRHSIEPISILIVDDDRLSAELNAAVLRSSGMMVRIVTDPKLALKVLEDELPDLILMDLQMPEIDGVQLSQVIRQSRQLLSLPIVFLSAERDESRQLLARRLGGDDFVTKPINPERLISLVRLRADRSKSLRSLIERDRLTGLFNHSRFQERLAQELERCRRIESEICLVMIDLDRFKQVNDRYGHPAGDTVLRSLSSAMVASVRQTDIVGRYGGEEFGIILLDTSAQPAKVVIDRIRQSFGQLTFEAGTRQFSVSFSAGVSSSRDFATVSDLVGAADRALYAAKTGGRDCVKLASVPHDYGRGSDAARPAEAHLVARSGKA